MKLKVIKAHYYDYKYRPVGAVYRANVKHRDSAIRRGLCELLPNTRKKRKPRDKRHPATIKGKLEKK